MRAVVLMAALAVLAANRAAAGSSANATEPQRHEEREPGSREGEPVPGPDYEEDEEEYEEAPPVHQYIVDDLIRGSGKSVLSMKRKKKGKNSDKKTEMATLVCKWGESRAILKWPLPSCGVPLAA